MRTAVKLRVAHRIANRIWLAAVQVITRNVSLGGSLLSTTSVSLIRSSAHPSRSQARASELVMFANTTPQPQAPVLPELPKA
jgi:hypothetical protein